MLCWENAAFRPPFPTTRGHILSLLPALIWIKVRQPKNPNMRTILTMFLGGILMAQGQTATPAQQAQGLYLKGIAAEKAGNVSAASEAYAQALQLNPNHPDARFRAGELKRNAGSIAAKGREAKFGQVVIPQIMLENATLSESLQALSLSIEKNSKAENVPNFVVMDPDKKLDNARVSLQLKGVPAKGVLEYILSQTSTKAVYNEHAIVIQPLAKGS